MKITCHTKWPASAMHQYVLFFVDIRNIVTEKTKITKEEKLNVYYEAKNSQ